MNKTTDTVAGRLTNIEAQLDRIAAAVVRGFDAQDKKAEQSETAIRKHVDIYARAIDSYASQAETYMQEMLALGQKVDRLERQIEQIAQHLNLKLSY